MIGNRVFVQILRIVSTVWHNYLVQPVVRKLPIKPGKRVLCFGDSNTWGYIPGTGLRYRLSIRWPGIVQEELAQEISVIEEGLGGRTTVLDDPEGFGRNGKKLLVRYLRRYQPLDMVILLLGTNDLKTHFNRTPDQIAGGLQELGEVVLNHRPSASGQSPILLLVSPPPVGNLKENASRFKDAPNKSALFGEKFKQVAEKLQCEFLDAGKVIESSAVDGIHWDEEAHRQLGLVIAERVRHLLMKA